MPKQYTHPLGWKDNVNFQTTPSSETQARELLQEQHDEILTFHNEHIDKYVSQHVISTRDLSLLGTQKISLPFKAKSIKITAHILNTKYFSDGVWAENGGASAVCVNNASTNYESAGGYIIIMEKDGSNLIGAAVSLVENDGFTLNWAYIVGSGISGTVNMSILASTH